MLRRVTDFGQIAVGVLASCIVAWALGELGLVSASGAPMNPGRALAVVGLVATIPVSMGATRALGRFAENTRRRRASARPSSNISLYYRLCVEYAFRDLARDELTPLDRDVIDRTSKELSTLVQRALRDSGRGTNVLQLPDTSDAVQHAMRDAVEQFRSASASAR